MTGFTPAAPGPEPVLAIDTSNRVGSLCLRTADGATTMRRLDPAGRRNAKTLIVEAAALCESVGVSLADVRLVCVATGPGSFTGLRVGVTFAKTVAFAVGELGARCDAVGVPTHAAVARFAHEASPSGTPLLVVSDALRDHLYVTRFVWQRTDEPPDAGPTRIVAVADFMPDAPVLCGDAGLRERIPGLPDERSEDAVVDAETVLAAGLKRWRAGTRDDPYALVPLYVRRSSAEETADAAGT